MAKPCGIRHFIIEAGGFWRSFPDAEDQGRIENSNYFYGKNTFKLQQQ